MAVIFEWQQAKTDYITTDISLKQLSEKYGIKYSSVLYRSKKDGWKKQPSCAASLCSGGDDADGENDEQREKRILELSDMLLDKIEKSISEIDRCIIKTKERTKTVEYDVELKKPVNETVEEKEDIQVIDGMVDKMGIKQLVSTLKDIKDIHLGLCRCDDADDEENGVILLGSVENCTLEQNGDEYAEDDFEERA